MNASANPLPHRVAILAVGTELTSGQVLNRNAVTLSERVTALGAEPVLHETVPDDRELIVSALDRCAAVAGIILVTGGLGPTSDDFTRKVVAQWAGAPLEFDEPSWTRIESRLRALGIPVAQSNRQQCDFPHGSVILPNPAGTASAFRLSVRGRQLIVLPGPPREIEAIWLDQALDSLVASWIPQVRPLQLRTWQCLGKSEAALGELTESALRGSGLAVGYRAHRPFVEVKVWIPQDSESIARAQPYLLRLEAAIGPWVATRQGADLAERWLRTLPETDSVEVIDLLTAGVFAERCADGLRRGIKRSIEVRTLWASGRESPSEVEKRLERSPCDRAFVLAPVSAAPPDSGQWILGWKEGSRVGLEILSSPFGKTGMEERQIRYTAEMALKILGDRVAGVQ